MATTIDTIDVLNRLLVIHNRSLPMYLSFAHPRFARGNTAASDTLAMIVEDQDRTIDRIGEMIVEVGADVAAGEFPMVFTAYNDISFDFLLPKIIEHQQQDIDAIAECAEQLEADPIAKAVAEEALGAAKGHLENLQELAEEHAASS
jgi:hypothetical protein